MNVREICEMIELPSGMSDQVVAFDEKFDYGTVEPYLQMLLEKENWDKGLTGIKETLGQDPDGVGMLSCMLHCGNKSWEMYRERGISKEIFAQTMKCFTRFVGEHMVSYGRYGFDRDFWTTRQLSLTLFRLGELEYELFSWKDAPAISVHIPSNSKMLPELIDASLAESVEFMKQYFPEYLF